MKKREFLDVLVPIACAAAAMLGFVGWLLRQLVVPAILIAAVLATFATEAKATHPCVVVQKQIVAQPVYAVPVVQNIYYSVGQSIQLEAIVERAVQQRLQAIQQQQAQQQATNPAESSPTPNQPDTANVFVANCASCHAGAMPKGGLLLDGSAPLTPEIGFEILRRLQLPVDDKQHMPPGKDLDGQTKGQILQTLLSQFARKDE